MSCGAALGWADEAPNPYVVRGGEKGIWEARECSNLDGRGHSSSIEFFLMADRSAEQRAELRSAGQPGAAVPTWFFFQIGMRAGSAQYPSHTGNVLQAVHAG